MKTLKRTNKFDKHFKKCRKRGKDLEKLATIITLLRKAQPLPDRCRPHKLSGNFHGLWECHIEPDWLLIYDYDDEKVSLLATGSHADLFR